MKIFVQSKSLSIENLYQIEIRQANEILQQIENEPSKNIEEILSDIEQGEFFSKEFFHLHQFNEQQIDLVRKTISQNHSVIHLVLKRFPTTISLIFL